MSFVILTFLIFTLPLMAQDNAYLITYSPAAGIAEGDDDFVQIIYFKIPASFTDSLFVRILDADVGGSRDARYGGVFDSETRFQLYGGDGAIPDNAIKSATPSNSRRKSGVLLKEETFGVNPFRDNRWYNFASFSPASGDANSGYKEFKLVVEGISGNDGNVSDVAISRNPQRNIPPLGLVMYTYSPTIRLPQSGVHGEIRFDLPKNINEIIIQNFDCAGASIALETAFRSNLFVTSSGQGEWSTGKVGLLPLEVDNLCAITFEGGTEIPNDATFFITDEDGNSIPLYLPVYIHKPNNRPVPNVKLSELSDSRSIMFDASKTFDEDGDPIDYFWDFGDGGSDIGSRVVHRYSSGGTYSASLLVVDKSGTVGNTAIKRFEVKVNVGPIANAGLDIRGMPGEKLTFDGSASHDPDGKIKRYLWDFGDGKRKTGETVTHKYKRTGHYSVSLRVEDNSDSPENYASDMLEVWINAKPIVEIGKDIISSPSETVSLDGSNSYDSDGYITDYNWDLGDGNVKNGVKIRHAYPKPGSYKVKLTVDDDAGVRNSKAIDVLTVVVNDPPDAVVKSNASVVARDEKVSFNAKSSVDRDGKLIDYHWTLGDGTTLNGSKVKHAYAAPGRYIVRLIVQDNSKSTSDTDSDEMTIIVNYPPIALAGPDQVVTTSKVYFDGGSSRDTDGTITRYHWNFGDGNSSNEAAPVHVYSHSGTYDVKLSVTDDSKTSTAKTSDNLTVIVNNLPIADAGPSQIGMPKQIINFDGSASVDPDGNINEYLWDFGDGTVGNGEFVSHAYQTSGTYSVLLTVRDNTRHSKAWDHSQTTVVINHSPIAIAGQDVHVSPSQPIAFNGTESYDIDGKIISYRWDFSDDYATVKKGEFTRTFETPGFYTATLTVVDNSGATNAQTQDRVLIQVNHRPESNAGVDMHTCDLTLLFSGYASSDADGDELTYYWDFGDGSPRKTGGQVYHTYAKTGVYPVILKVDDGTNLKNATNSSSITVSINQAPRADAGEDKTVCAGEVVLFDGGGSSDEEGGLLKYAWDFGDGTFADGVNPTKTFSLGGVYLVTLTLEDDSGLPCNRDTDQIVVRVAESPVADAGDDMTACANTEIVFDGTRSRDFDGLVNAFDWDFGDGSSGGGPNPTHVFTEPGRYLVTLTVTGDQIGECDNNDQDDLLVIVHEAPIASFRSPALVAVDLTVAFDATLSESSSSIIDFYEWDFGDGKFGEGEMVDHIYLNSGKYVVILTVTTNSETDCNSTSTKSLITVNESPFAEAGANQLIGSQQIVRFNGSSSTDKDGVVASYHWDFGDGEESSGVQVRHLYKESGNYTVVLRVTDDTPLSNNWSIDSLFVNVNSAPVPQIECRKIACVDEPINFSGAGSTDSDGEIVNYSWNFGDGEQGEGVEISHEYFRSGVYQATLAVDDGRGVSNSLIETTVTIVINYPPTADAGKDQRVLPETTVQFDGGGSKDIDGKITAYNWNFGDGNSGTGVKPSHSYAQPGLYDVKLTVTDDSETNCSAGIGSIQVRVNALPVAAAGPDISAFFGGAHDAVLFDGTGSYDSDKDPLNYYWDFGDDSHGTGPKVSYIYTVAGTFTVRLRVRDSAGTLYGESWDKLTVTVKSH